jgi:hypothetical protein
MKMSVSQERIVIKMQIVLILLVHTDVNVDMAMKEMGCFVENCKFYMSTYIITTQYRGHAVVQSWFSANRTELRKLN